MMINWWQMSIFIGLQFLITSFIFIWFDFELNKIRSKLKIYKETNATLASLLGGLQKFLKDS